MEKKNRFNHYLAWLDNELHHSDIVFVCYQRVHLAHLNWTTQQTQS